ncbi:hypothetical protein DMB38_34500 [Streptomyces sp. WAC 06738]|uniref:SGNH/GDSL hydrolase family protein n=1 Tax=Streptomyces sp. WAC 06738 TaxID=2203210 RepID=UPI000F6F4882|nr:SGNH/GDSL hydrolase family protein [Streptomyces sp. WAC 06738]AZM50216.1 hypothetical protein DMB38_34500 [Streptomyces sp. WAC 06738]
MLVLGDSFSSGEGLFDLKGPCARSAHAYGPVAADSPELDGYLVQRGAIDVHACTGARSYRFDDPEEPDPEDLPAQLATVRAGRMPYGLIAITIGGNDLGFSPVIEECIMHRLSWKRPGCQVSEGELKERVDRLGRRLPGIYDQIGREALASGGHLAVLGYPQLFEDPDKWTGRRGFFGVCNGVFAADAERFRRVSDYLNDTIRKAVEKTTTPGVEFIDVARGFDKGHNLCGKDPWLNSLAAIPAYWFYDTDQNIWQYEPKGEIRFEVAMHPNRFGHAYEADLLVDAVTTRFDWSEFGTAPTATPSPPPGGGAGGPNEICREASHERVCVHTGILTGSDEGAGMGLGPYAQPRTMYVGSNLTLQDLQWQDWGKPTARARGRTASTDCEPNCGEGEADRQRVQVEVSQLVDTEDLRVYTCARARKAGQGWGSLGVKRVCLDVNGEPVGG